MTHSLLELPLQRKNLPKKEHLLFPMEDGVYVVPSPSGSNWSAALSDGGSIIMALVFSRLTSYLEKKDEQLLALYNHAYQTKDTATLLRHRKSFLIPFSSIQKIYVDARKQALTTDWDKGKFIIYLTNRAPITFSFLIYSDAQLIKDFIAAHFAGTELEWIE